MDYEKKYKNALELAKDYFKANQRLGELEENDMLSDIFPELAESEDERIRKTLIDYFNTCHGDYYGELKRKDILAWLEKQGETYTKKDIDNAYLEGMAFAKDELEKQNKQILANSAKTCKDEQQPTDNDMKELLHTEYEKGRADAIAEIQNPAWSEEDEEFLRRAINVTKDAYPMTAKWLKSLRPQSQWKPSDEQLRELRCVISGCSFETPILVQLEEDLKKLL